MTLAVGQEAPDFELVGTAPAPFRLSELRGKENVVLAFYELAFNDACTDEMLAFEELLPEFEAAGTRVVGISIDPKGVVDGFASSNGLSFDLLCDSFQHEVCLQYEAWQDSMGFASEHGGIARRVTYVIDRQGVVRGVVENTADARDHAGEALRIVQGMEAL